MLQLQKNLNPQMKWFAHKVDSTISKSNLYTTEVSPIGMSTKLSWSSNYTSIFLIPTNPAAGRISKGLHVRLAQPIWSIQANLGVQTTQIPPNYRCVADTERDFVWKFMTRLRQLFLTYWKLIIRYIERLNELSSEGMSKFESCVRNVREFWYNICEITEIAWVWV